MAEIDRYKIADYPEAAEPKPELPAETLGNLDIERLAYLLSFLSPEGPPYEDPSTPKPMGSGGIPFDYNLSRFLDKTIAGHIPKGSGSSHTVPKMKKRVESEARKKAAEGFGGPVTETPRDVRLMRARLKGIEDEGIWPAYAKEVTDMEGMIESLVRTKQAASYEDAAETVIRWAFRRGQELRRGKRQYPPLEDTAQEIRKIEDSISAINMRYLEDPKYELIFDAPSATRWKELKDK